MIRELYKLMDKTFSKKCETPEEIREMLVDGESVFTCHVGKNDYVAFTDRRLMVKDTRGKKTAIYSIPYDSVKVWSSENVGTVDINSEVTLWTDLEKIKINLGKDADVRAIDRFLAEKIVG